ncbi:MAG: DUF4465 domain-containing protein [Bacteroidetes bacterium]|nr:DUF4465 domain-containing protein [Bacteroidota bacterium]
MTKNYSFMLLIACLLLFMSANPAKSQTTATFDNLSLTPNSFWNGSDNSGGFTNAGYFFENSYTDYGGGMYAWYGFAYSNMSDTITTGYTNQFSAICGKGALNSVNYAVSYVNYDWANNYAMQPNMIRFSSPKTISGIYVTNNTYAYYSMLNGDGTLAKKFGGSSGNDPDWFKLQIKGYHNGNITDSVNFYLADFRFANNSQDYIVKTWKWVDLSTLGSIDSLSFGLLSSDNGAYGMNTPAYFCMDNFNGSVVSVKETSDKTVSIYPNPCSDYLHINLIMDNNSTKLSLTDISGKEVLSKFITSDEIDMDLSSLSKGIYFVKIVNEKSSYFNKIIKN